MSLIGIVVSGGGHCDSDCSTRGAIILGIMVVVIATAVIVGWLMVREARKPLPPGLSGKDRAYDDDDD